MEELVDNINRAVLKLQFGAGARIRFYESLVLMLQNNVQLGDALRELHAVVSDNGKKNKTAEALIYQHCIDSLNNGASLSDALEHWVNPTEAALLRAGEKSGELQKAMGYVTGLIQKKKAMLAALTGATLYPLILSGLAGFLLNMISTQLVPKFAKLAPPEQWQGAARLLYLVADSATRYGSAIVIGLVIAIVAVIVSLPTLRGPLRPYLDRLFPYSAYRMLHGSSFLLGVALMVSSGQQLRESLLSLAHSANPWLRERIDGALDGVDAGKNFGAALAGAGHDFPDRIAIQYLTIFANRDGFEAAMVNYAHRWMEQSVAMMQRIGSIALGIGLMTVALLMLLVIAGAGEITNMVQSGMR